MEKIIDYLRGNYNPNTLILYGSFADGSNNQNSDFDALLITDDDHPAHDSSVVDGILLDVFIQNTSEFIEDGGTDFHGTLRSSLNYEDFIQIFDGSIVIDRYGIGRCLKDAVLKHIENCPVKTTDENEIQVQWCEKMLLRVQRDDAEGYFRWHWLLADSLEIYCDICKVRYLGPKKSLIRMKKEDFEAFCIYETALTRFEYSCLEQWIAHLRLRLELERTRTNFENEHSIPQK